MKIVLSAILATMLLGGCASSGFQSNVYQTGQVQQAMKVVTATVIDVREVKIERESTQHGSHIGAAVGAIASTRFSRGGLITGLAGAVIGGIAGAVAEKNLSAGTGVEIVYKLDGSEEVQALVQEGQDGIRPGDRIRIISGATTRAVLL